MYKWAQVSDVIDEGTKPNHMHAHSHTGYVVRDCGVHLTCFTVTV